MATQAHPPDATAASAHVLAYHTSRWACTPLCQLIFGNESHTPALVSTSPGRVIFRLGVSESHLNAMGSLHGAVSAFLVDWAGSLAIAALDGRSQTGVSVDMHVNFISGAQAGAEVEIEGKVEKIGKNLAFTTVGVWKVGVNGERGEAVALGSHTKFVRSA